MTYAAGPANNLHQWLNKYVPELQVKPVGNQAISDTNSAEVVLSGATSVSLSKDAARLNDIVKRYFPEGGLSSEQARSVGQSLYQQGVITAEDFRLLTGEKLPHTGTITQALEFMTRFIEIESVDGDVEGARSLNAALDVLRNIEDPMTAFRANRERESTHFVREYRNLLQEAEVEPELIHEFDRVVNVFDALEGLREQASQGVVTTFASLNAKLRGGSA